jgi:ribosome-associated toxin RatA of RatAB toxin-antitoxin module
MRSHSVAALALLVLCPVGVVAQDIAVRVERRGETVVVDVKAQVAAPLREAWAVFTDYENMAAFISNLTASKVLSRTDHSLEVMQSGRTQVGFLSFGFEAVRAVELVPMREIRSSLISGDFKAYASTTSLAPTASGTEIRHHGEYEPKRWLPPLIGPAVIERETKKQYQEFAAEIERRRAAARR